MIEEKFHVPNVDTQRSLIINPYPSKKLSRKFCLPIMSAAYIQMHFRPDILMEANNMNPDLGLYCLQ